MGVCLFVYFLHAILTPFLVAVVLAYMFDPVVDRLERFGFSRTWGVVTVFALFTIVLMALLLVLVPLLAKQLLKLYQLAPLVLDWLQHTAMPWAQTKLGLSDSFGISTRSKPRSPQTWGRPRTSLGWCCRKQRRRAWR